MAHSRSLALLAALTLVAAACDGTTADTTTTTTSTSRPATTTPGATTVPASSGAMQERIDELMIEAQQIRGLEFLEPVDVVLLGDADYEARFIESLDEDITEEDVQAYTAELRLLGIMEPEDDYRDIIETFVSAGTLGFYDSRTGELVVRLSGDSLGPVSESTVIHELVHALQDQHFSLLDDRQDLEGDAAYVALAIIEGDASLRDITYVSSLSLADQARYVREALELQTSAQAALATLPAYVVNGILSAYPDGLIFHQQIGLDAIDEQFEDPPESSEQLLEADKYRRDEQPKDVTLPEFDLPGYEVFFDASAGQKELELLLTEAVGPGRAADAASGWGGDINRVYNRGEEEAVYVLRYLGDTKRDAEELEAAFAEFLDEMVADDAYTFLQRDATEVMVIIASDAALGPQLRAGLAE